MIMRSPHEKLVEFAPTLAKSINEIMKKLARVSKDHKTLAFIEALEDGTITVHEVEETAKQEQQITVH